MPLIPLSRTLLLAAGLAAVASLYPSLTMAQPVGCALNAIIAHRVGGATLLRAAPSIRAKARAPIPWRRGGLVAVVKAGDRGWFRVAAVRDPRGRLAMKANGWLHGSRLKLRLKSVGGKGIPLHEDPSPKARVDIRLNPALAARSPGVLLACRGGWARVRIGRVIGWLPPANQCARPTGPCR